MPVAPPETLNIDQNTISRALDSRLEAKTLDITNATFTEEGNGTFAGYASVFGNVDTYGDIVEKGAYTSTITDFLKDGFIAWNHGWQAQPIATIQEAKEDDFGLWVSAEFHSTSFAQDIRKIVQERLARNKSMGLSIGYVADEKDHDEKGHRLLKKISLFEVSLVNMPANRAAQVVSSKSDNPGENKAVNSVRDFEVHPDRNKSFDRPAAESRIREWAGVTDGPNQKYASAFIWHADGDDPDGDGVPDKFGDYKLPIIDIVNGKPMVFAHAVFRNAVVVQGGRGGLNVPDGDKAKIRETLSGYYAKLREKFNDDSLQPPWGRSKSMFTEEELKAYNESEEKSEQIINVNGKFDPVVVEAITNEVINKILSGVGVKLWDCTPEEIDAIERLDAELKAEWDTAYINDLPDSAFAVILPGGKRDGEGKTVPRSLRKLPHHDSSGKVDLSHLRNALARLEQTNGLGNLKSKAENHLNSHAKEEGVGKDNQSTKRAELPDSAFAYVAPGAVWKNGRSSDDHRFFLHHDEKGETSEDLIVSALQELIASDIQTEEKASIRSHLLSHANDHGIDIQIKETGIVPDHIEDSVLTFVAEAENTLARVQSLTTRTEAVAKLRAKDGRQLSAANRQRLMTVRDGLKDHSQTISRLLEENDVRPAENAANQDYSGNTGTDVSEGVRKDNTHELLKKISEELSNLTIKATAENESTEDMDYAESLKKILDLVENVEDALSDCIAQLDPNFKPEEDNDTDDKKSMTEKLEVISRIRKSLKLAKSASDKKSKISFLKLANDSLSESKSVLGLEEAKEIDEATIIELETLARLNGVRY